MANILCGISGSIAAFKTVSLLRELNKQGHTCQVVITSGGLQFINPELIAGLGFNVYTDKNLNYQDPSNAMLHINLAKWAEQFIIVPASANLIATLAHGLANNLLTQIALAYTNSPIYLAPAMNQAMWANPILQHNLQLLRNYNYQIWEPCSGVQACGDNGMGRLLEVDRLLELIRQNINDIPNLKDQHLLINLGASIEEIDPVRYISNYSSGKMGKALIEAALSANMQVTAIAGKLSVNLPSHPALKIVSAQSAQQMLSACLTNAPNADIFIACAAICDYRVIQPMNQKIKKTNEQLT